MREVRTKLLCRRQAEFNFCSVTQNNSLLSKHRMLTVPMPSIGTRRLTYSFIVSVLQLILLVPVTCICTVQQLEIMARKSYTSPYSYSKTIKTFILSVRRNLEWNYKMSVNKNKGNNTIEVADYVFNFIKHYQNNYGTVHLLFSKWLRYKE